MRKQTLVEYSFGVLQIGSNLDIGSSIQKGQPVYLHKYPKHTDVGHEILCRLARWKDLQLQSFSRYLL